MFSHTLGPLRILKEQKVNVIIGVDFGKIAISEQKNDIQMFIIFHSGCHLMLNSGEGYLG